MRILRLSMKVPDHPVILTAACVSFTSLIPSFSAPGFSSHAHSRGGINNAQIGEPTITLYVYEAMR
jgi:hypothetical protein